MFENCKNTKEQGNIGLGCAIQYFSQNLYTVSWPLNDSQDYDLIIEDCAQNGLGVGLIDFLTTTQIDP